MKSLLFSIGIVFIISCNAGNENTTMPSGNEKVVNQLFDHFNKHEWEKLSELYKDTADFKDPALGNGSFKQSKQQVATKYKQLNAFLPDINIRSITLYPSGSTNIIAEYVSSGTFPDGSKVDLPICTIFTIENGKIAKDYSYYDNAAPPAASR